MAVDNYRRGMFLLWRVFVTETDENNRLTRKELTDRVRAKGYEIGEKEFSTDYSTLWGCVKSFGYELSSEKSKNNQVYYWVSKRPWSIAEIHILVDMILSSKYVTKEKSMEMIGKLKDLLGREQGKLIQPQVYVHGRIKSMNASVFESSQSIQTAIRRNKRLKYYYCQWDENKKLRRKYDGADYILSPVGVVADFENYYLAGYTDEGEQRHYRIDKIEDIVVLEEERLPGLEYSLEKFMKEYRMMFGMFGGEEEKVTILCKKEKIGILIDRFGYDIPILKHGNMLKTVVTVQISDQFLGWMYSIARFARIIGNEKAVKAYGDYLEEEYRRWNEEITEEE